MKVQDLIDQLSEHNPDAEVRLMHQPGYPLESTILGVIAESQIRQHEARELGDDPEVVWVLEGRQLGYGKAIAWEAAEGA